MALLELDPGKAPREVAETLGVNYDSVTNLCDKYLEHGLATAIEDVPWSGRLVESLTARRRNRRTRVQ